MNRQEIGLLLTRARKKAGLTQAEVAARMGVSQPVIARAESGDVLPRLTFLDRFAKATGQPVIIELNPRRRPIGRQARRQRVRKATGRFVFDPWERDPSEAEQRSLLADGLTRERFSGSKAP